MYNLSLKSFEVNMSSRTHAILESSTMHGGEERRRGWQNDYQKPLFMNKVGNLGGAKLPRDC